MAVRLDLARRQGWLRTRLTNRSGANVAESLEYIAAANPELDNFRIQKLHTYDAMGFRSSQGRS